MYLEHTMQGNTSSNVNSDLDEDLLDSMPRLEAKTADGAVVMTCLIVGAIAVVGNMHVLTVFVKNNRLFENINTTFIANQSVLDSIASFVIIMNGIYTRQLDKGLSATLLCKLWMTRTLMWGLMESSTFNLMAISFERYMAIVHPMWYKAYFTNSKASIAAILIWFCGVSSVASIMIPSTGVLRGGCMVTGFWPWRNMAQTVGFVHIFVNSVTPVFVHSFCYARIASALRKRISKVTPKDDTASTTLMGKTGKTSATRTTEAGAIHTLGDDADSTRGAAVSLPSTSGANVRSDSTELASLSLNKQEIRNDKTKGNVVKTLAIVTACYFISWLPNQLHIILYLLGTISTFGTFYNTTVILAFLNCCISPIIYIGKGAVDKRASRWTPNPRCTLDNLGRRYGSCGALVDNTVHTVESRV